MAGEGGKAIQTIELSKGEFGTWEAEVHKDIKNRYYTFQTNLNGKWQLECPDIYAKAVGVNGTDFRGLQAITNLSPFRG